MYIKANAANCLQVQLAAPEIMTEHRKSVKCQNFISTCVQMQEIVDGMAMCLQQGCSRLPSAIISDNFQEI